MQNVNGKRMDRAKSKERRGEIAWAAGNFFFKSIWTLTFVAHSIPTQLTSKLCIQLTTPARFSFIWALSPQLRRLHATGDQGMMNNKRQATSDER